MSEIMLLWPGLSSVNGKVLSARFDGGALSSDTGLLALREVERRLDVAGRLVRDRLCRMRFCGLTVADPVPDANSSNAFVSHAKLCSPVAMR